MLNSKINFQGTQFFPIQVKYLGPTPYKGSRVKLYFHDISFGRTFKAQKILSWNYAFNSSIECAINYIESQGIEIQGYSTAFKDFDLVLINWEDYEKLFGKVEGK